MLQLLQLLLPHFIRLHIINNSQLLLQSSKKKIGGVGFLLNQREQKPWTDGGEWRASTVPRHQRCHQNRQYSFEIPNWQDLELFLHHQRILSNGRTKRRGVSNFEAELTEVIELCPQNATLILGGDVLKRTYWK